MSGYAWIPPEDWVEHAHATALARMLGVDGYHELLALSTAEPVPFWDAVARALGVPWDDAVRARARRLGRAGMGPLVRRRTAQPHQRVRRALGRRPRARRRRGRRLRGRGGRHSLAHLRGAGARGGALRRGPGGARRPQRRRGRIAHADGARGRDRVLRGGRDRRDRACRSSRASPRRAVASRLAGLARRRADHGRRLPPRQPGARQGDGRRGSRSRAERALVVVVRHIGRPVAWQDGRDVWWHERSTADAGTRTRDPGRERAPVHDRLHLGHDRQAQGRGPRPRRVPGQDRAGGRATGPTCSPATACTG